MAAAAAGSPSVPSAIACTSTQYGHEFAADTAAATASLPARLAAPPATSDSRSISHAAASTSGDGECSAIGGASIPKSRSTCR
jgi:hypothetical protein